VRVLLVDDHRLFREGMKQLLEGSGVGVVAEAANGADALATVRTLRDSVDLVLMDLDMPVSGGLDATRRIKAEWPALPVVILTASDDDEHLFEAIKSGANGYLLKSYSPETVVELVKAAVDGAPALTPSLAAKILDEFARQAAAPAPRPAPSGPPPDELVEPLTTRELEVLEVLKTGATNREIADRLYISENTVKYHLKNILGKLHLQNRAQVVAYALRHAE
jgi:DNA-binding NarL/FixJ family response regulator